MPSDAKEARSASASGAAATSGWDAATGEYVVRTPSGAVDDGDACKARWRGVKGLDAEC